jgi:hypothetical protein
VAVVKVDMSGVPYSEVRYAMRGVSRSGKEFAAAEIYARVLEARLAELVAKNGGSDAEVVHEEHILPGAFILSYRSQPSAPVLLAAGQPGSDASPLRSLLSRTVSEAEFAAAKNAVTAGMEKRDPADAWLDVDTYRITSPSDELKAFQTASLADVNALASRVANEPLAAAVVSALPDATTN